MSHYSNNLYQNTVAYLEGAMQEFVPCNQLIKIAKPMLDILPVKDINHQLLSIIARNRPNHQGDMYNPLAYFILDSYAHFYTNKKLALIDFAWEMAGTLSENDSGVELFKKLILLAPEHINYDSMSNVQNNDGINASIATQVLMQNHYTSVVFLKEEGVNFTDRLEGRPSVIEEYLKNTENSLILGEIKVDEDFINIIKMFTTEEKTKNIFINAAKDYPHFNAIINNIMIEEKLQELPHKTNNKKIKI